MSRIVSLQSGIARSASEAEHPWMWPDASWSAIEGGGTTAFDWSGNGNHASLIGGPTWSPSSRGPQLSLDGINDYADIPSKAGDGLSQFAVIAWVDKTTSDYAFIMRRTNISFASIGLELYPSTAYFTVSQTGYDTGYGYVATALNGLHCYAMVFDGTAATSATRLRAYIDGVQQSLTFAGSLPTVLSSTVGNTWKVGLRETTGTFSQFTCQDIRFLSRAPSDAEVSAIYAFGPNAHLIPRRRRSAFASTIAYNRRRRLLTSCR